MASSLPCVSSFYRQCSVNVLIIAATNKAQMRRYLTARGLIVYKNLLLGLQLISNVHVIVVCNVMHIGLSLSDPTKGYLIS